MKASRLGTVLVAGALALAAAPAAQASLGAAWHFDEGSGATAADASGNGNHGAITGATWTSGRFDDGLRFDGDDDSVHVARADSLMPATVTVEAWVRAPQSPGNFRHIASVGANACLAAAYGLYTGNNGGIGFYVRDGLESFAVSPLGDASIWDGAWHHVAGTFDGATLRLFVDGAEVGAGAPAAGPIDYSTDTQDFLIGIYSDVCVHQLDYTGDLDEVRVWGRAMGAGEIAASSDMADGSADRLAVERIRNDRVLLTKHFTARDAVTISLESASGTQRIDSVSMADSSASCGGFLTSRCDITLRNGGRTADLRVRRGLGSVFDDDAWLRVRLKSDESVYVEVELD